jgi:hypothetical protein
MFKPYVFVFLFSFGLVSCGELFEENIVNPKQEGTSKSNADRVENLKLAEEQNRQSYVSLDMDWHRSSLKDQFLKGKIKNRAILSKFHLQKLEVVWLNNKKKEILKEEYSIDYKLLPNTIDSFKLKVNPPKEAESAIVRLGEISSI